MNDQSACLGEAPAQRPVHHPLRQPQRHLPVVHVHCEVNLSGFHSLHRHINRATTGHTHPFISMRPKARKWGNAGLIFFFFVLLAWASPPPPWPLPAASKSNSSPKTRERNACRVRDVWPCERWWD
jgi:hypothetical protein